MRYISLVALVIFSLANAYAAKINDFSAEYNVYQNGFYLGTSKRSLTTRDDTLTFTSVTQSGGIAAWFIDVRINETSIMKLKNNVLQVYSYLYDEKQNSKHEVLALKIDQTGQLYNSYNHEHYPLTPQLYDGLGFSVALMHDLKNGLRKLNYTIAEKEHLKAYHLKFIGYEKLPTDGKSINTLKMEHYDPQSKYRFTFWCAESMDFLPLRIRNIKSNGDEIVLNLTHFNQQAVYLQTKKDDDNI